MKKQPAVLLCLFSVLLACCAVLYGEFFYARAVRHCVVLSGTPLTQEMVQGAVLNGDGIAEACIDTELEASAKEALAQIERRQYVTAMKQEGITHFFKIGVSFYKKRVKLLSDTE